MADAAIRSISRALLLLLRTMNASHKVSLYDLHLRTGLAKSTVFRILHEIARAYADRAGA